MLRFFLEESNNLHGFYISTVTPVLCNSTVSTNKDTCDCVSHVNGMYWNNLFTVLVKDTLKGFEFASILTPFIDGAQRNSAFL